MTLAELIKRFVLVKQEKPSNVNELLDFIQCRYVRGELSIVEYRNLLRELCARGAEKPKYFPEQAAVSQPSPAR